MASKPYMRSTPKLGTRQAGMSLLEIIIVIVLIGAVMTLVGSRVFGGFDRGKAGMAKSHVQMIAGKIDEYRVDTGRYPAQLEDLIRAPSGAPGWLGPYVKKEAELNDPWGNALLYRIPGQQGQPFDLISLGRDGREGGSSVDADVHFE